ncbi:hypothetical protein B0O80DRAFT_433846 [Mortierella sp. GBAus27b]|nr:hypothetical protein B0O80DRAFT_433846 [Mortierella sp. GBAus27b]
MNAGNHGHPGIQPHTEALQVGYSVASTPHVPHSSHPYPQLTGTDSRYSPYAPGAPFAPQANAPFAPQAPPSQVTFQPQAPQPPATTPFAAPPPSVGSSGPEHNSTLFIPPAPVTTLAQPGMQLGYQPVQDPFYPSGPIPSTSYPQQGFQGVAGQQHPPQAGQYASFSSQAPLQAAPAAVAPVEERPLIEL